MRGLTRDSVVELVDRKMLWVFGALTVIGLMMVFSLSAIDIEMYGQGVDVGEINEALGNPVLKAFNMFMYVMVFLVVLATAGLIPSMLVKGRAEYYLSKPVSRSSLFFNKVAAIWLVYGALMSLCFLVVYIVATFLLDAFHWGFLIIIVSNLLQFFIWLSVVAFIGIFTGSAAISIMTAFGLWLIQLLLIWVRSLQSVVDIKAAGQVADVLYYILPKTIEISDATVGYIQGAAVDWMPVYSSLIFAVALLYLAAEMFQRKDY